MWTMMKQLRKRIIRLLRSGSIINKDVLSIRIHSQNKWNPYCIYSGDNEDMFHGSRIPSGGIRILLLSGIPAIRSSKSSIA
jgi:hypothetical protein